MHVLNKKKLLFAEAYTNNLDPKTFQNIYQSAIKAGYSDNYARTGACKLLAQDKIREYIEKKVDGINVKMIFCDYIDVMSPTVRDSRSSDEYYAHGIITQELRNIARHHKVPIFTATQNTRGSENPNHAMSNDMVGDEMTSLPLIVILMKTTSLIQGTSYQLAA